MFGVTVKVVAPPASTVAVAGEMLPPAPAVALTAYVVTLGEPPDDPPPQAVNSMRAAHGAAIRGKLEFLCTRFPCRVRPEARR